MRGDYQRYFKSLLRQTIADLRMQLAITPALSDAIRPLFCATLGDFWMLRGQAGGALAKLSSHERTFGWAFINALRDELRAQALQEVQSSKDRGMLLEFAETRTSIREGLTFENFIAASKAMHQVVLNKPAWFVFMLRDAFDRKKQQLRAQAPAHRRHFWRRRGLVIKPEFKAVLQGVARVSNDNVLAVIVS
jgi:hypothetical protein